MLASPKKMAIDHLVFDELRCGLVVAYLVAGASESALPPLFTAVLDVDCPYTRTLLLESFARRPWWRVLAPSAAGSVVPAADLFFGEYERVDWDRVMGPPHMVVNNLCIRKGLSRKSHFAKFMARFVAKRPGSALRAALPPTICIDTMPAFHDRPAWLDLPSALSEALLDADEAMATNPGSLWILKPSMANKGAEIHILNSIVAVEEVLRAWRDVGQWVLQRYIERPLLIGSKKFHIRVYALANSALDVYVFREALMLLAAHDYDIRAPENVQSHITNTCVNTSAVGFSEGDNVRLLSQLPGLLLPEQLEPWRRAQAARGETAPVTAASEAATASSFCAGVYARICEVVGECFLAVAHETAVYMPLTNAFELYGVDLMLEAALCEGREGAGADSNEGGAAAVPLPTPALRVLEFNPTPDVRQTGPRLQGVIAAALEGAVHICLDSRFPPPEPPLPASSLSPQQSGPPAVGDSAAPSETSSSSSLLLAVPVRELHASYSAAWAAAAQAPPSGTRAAAFLEATETTSAPLLQWDRILSLPQPSGAATTGIRFR